MATAASEETLGFQAEVGRLLDLMVNAVYSEKEIFLRELVSNASDACDRLRYEAVTRPELIADDPEFRIVLTIDKAARTLTIADNGIGMTRDDLVENLGTIARSGTAAFVEQLTGDSRKDVQLIGQFGVGFYSGFMVADRVEVVTRRAGTSEPWRWVSDGKGAFTVAPAERDARGTEIVLHLKKDADEFLERSRLEHIVKTYSDHIAVPIKLIETGADAADAATVNRASALWSRPRSEIGADDYTEFYRHVGHNLDEPWLTLHWRAEGTIEYTALLFVPTAKPFDLFHPDRKGRVKLYVRRVFITDDAAELLPAWLRFLTGVVDSEDLPLNISREMLQHNPVLRRIRNGLVQRVLSELEKQANDEPERYAAFWGNFGAVLKEGNYEDSERREALLKLARFRTTRQTDGLASLADYLERMVDGQEAIYYIGGDDAAALAKSPQIEGFRARGVEVLLLSDPIDEFWVAAVGEHEGKPFRSVTRAGTDLAKLKVTESASAEGDAPAADIAPLIVQFRLALGDEVKDVRVSERLTESPVCLVADEGDLDLHIERLLKLHGQQNTSAPRILEVNASHPLIRALAERLKGAEAADLAADYARLLLDQARIVEGEPPPDPAAFSRRLADVLAKGVGG